jgi:putative DNA primase/helicase
MAHAMNPEPEYTRHERFVHYAEALHERFAQGCLAELQELTQWVVWRAEIEDGRPKKVPYNPHYEHLQARASVKIPKSWGTLADALLSLESGHYSGIGFMITPPLVMIGLDHSVERATQTITDPQAAEIVQSLNSYTELSPSGTGLHILTYGQLPGKGIHTEVEIYGQDRFTTITMQHLEGTPPTIEHRQEALDSLYHRFAPAVTETTNQNTRGGVASGSTLTELPPEA